MSAPYDYESDAGLYLPRRDYGAYALLFALLAVVGSVEGVLVYHLLRMIGVIG